MSAATTERYLGVQGRGVIALPIDIRRRHQLDQPGAQVRVVERRDGVIELHPSLPVPADQKWFWTQEWQRREREVDEAVALGDVQVYETTEDFLAHLDDISSSGS